MKIFNGFKRMSLFKSKKAEIPDYPTFQLLLDKHNNRITLPLMSHFRNNAMKLLVYSYRNNLSLLTQTNYETAVKDIDKVKEFVKNWYDQLPNDYQFIVKHLVINTPAMSVVEVADNIKKSKTSVRRYLDASLDTLMSGIHESIFNNKPNRMVKKTETIFVDDRRLEYIKPICNDTEGHLLIEYINTAAELNWNLPDTENSTLWQQYCVATGKLFELPSLKVAVGARILFEGGGHEDVKKARQILKIDSPSDSTDTKNYRHCKRSFIKYLKAHKEEASKILAEVKDNGNNSNLCK